MQIEEDKNKGFFSRLGKKATKKTAAKATSKVKKVETEAAKKLRTAELKKKLAESKAKAAKARIQKAYKPTGSAGLKPAAKAKAAGAKIIATHRVQKGDTLSQIAKKYYGSGAASYYKLIQSANPDLIKDVNLIYPGQVFKIPELPDELKK